jgi:hypothetical protein
LLLETFAYGGRKTAGLDKESHLSKRVCRSPPGLTCRPPELPSRSVARAFMAPNHKGNSLNFPLGNGLPPEPAAEIIAQYPLPVKLGPGNNTEGLRSRFAEAAGVMMRLSSYRRKWVCLLFGNYIGAQCPVTRGESCCCRTQRFCVCDIDSIRSDATRQDVHRRRVQHTVRTPRR